MPVHTQLEIMLKTVVHVWPSASNGWSLGPVKEDRDPTIIPLRPFDNDAQRVPGVSRNGKEPNALHSWRAYQQREKVLSISPPIIEGHWRAVCRKSLPGLDFGPIGLIVPLPP